MISILLKPGQRAVKLFLVFVSLKDRSQHCHVMAGVNQHPGKGCIKEDAFSSEQYDRITIPSKASEIDFPILSLSHCFSPQLS